MKPKRTVFLSHGKAHLTSVKLLIANRGQGVRELPFLRRVPHLFFHEVTEKQPTDRVVPLKFPGCLVVSRKQRPDFFRKKKCFLRYMNSANAFFSIYLVIVSDWYFR